MSKNVLAPLLELAEAVKVADERITQAGGLDRAVREAQDRLSRLRSDAEAAEVSLNEARADARSVRIQAETDSAHLLESATVRGNRLLAEAQDKAKLLVDEALERAAASHRQADLVEATCVALEAEKAQLVAQVSEIKEQLLALRSRFVD